MSGHPEGPDDDRDKSDRRILKELVVIVLLIIASAAIAFAWHQMAP